MNLPEKTINDTLFYWTSLLESPRRKRLNELLEANGIEKLPYDRQLSLEEIQSLLKQTKYLPDK